MGPTPRVTITDPQLIKEIFSNIEVFQKPVTNPLGKFLLTGLQTYDGEKWATHRSLVNPAFHLEKLKIISHLNLFLSVAKSRAKNVEKHRFF